MSSKKVPIVAIVGQANVGKSSLYNAILQRREAIVAKEPGTTRDSLTAKASHRGHDFWLVDTAGVKDAADDFELTIQEQIASAIDSADVIMVVIEADQIITDGDRQLTTKALKSRKPVLLVVNKHDKKPTAKSADYQKLGVKPILLTSTTQSRGISDLLDSLVVILPKAQIKQDDDRIRVAVLGRPNVGKSLLFNAMAKKQQAIVADRAGTTRDVNRVIIKYRGQEIELMDTAGIRRGGKIARGVEYFSVLRSLSAIEEADVCLLLVDANEIEVALDQKIAGLVKTAGKGLVLVISKWDSLIDKDAYTRDALAPRIKRTYEFVPWVPLIFTSALTGQNVTKIFDLVLDIVKQRHKVVPTPELNRWLNQTTDLHPPAGLKNKAPRLFYIVQENDNPSPTFKVFGAQTKFLHWSYKRYLERQLRERFGFEGTAIKFWFFDRGQNKAANLRKNDRLEAKKPL